MFYSYIIYIIILLVVTVIESTWLSSLNIYRPDISLLVLTYLSFKSTSAQGIVSGFVSGLIIDGTSLAPWGYSALLRTAIAWIYSIFSGKLILDRLFIPMLMGFTASLIKYIIMLLLFLIFKIPSTITSIISLNTLIEIGLNTAAAPLVFLLLSLIVNFRKRDKDIV